MNTFLKYSLISGAILMIDFAVFCQVKDLCNISEKDWLNLFSQPFYCCFLNTNITQEGRDQGIISHEAIFSISQVINHKKRPKIVLDLLLLWGIRALLGIQSKTILCRFLEQTGSNRESTLQDFYKMTLLVRLHQKRKLF